MNDDSLYTVDLICHQNLLNILACESLCCLSIKAAAAVQLMQPLQLRCVINTQNSEEVHLHLNCYFKIDLDVVTKKKQQQQ